MKRVVDRLVHALEVVKTQEDTSARVFSMTAGEPGPNPIRRLDTWVLHSSVLQNEREVYVYLPECYASEPERRFPVFYLNDGQNLFDGRKSYLVDHTWCAGETADCEIAAGRVEPVILVGVANSGIGRMAEYTPTRDLRQGGGRGRDYGRLLMAELKPFLDTAYRTLPEREHTAIGGSSLGGLISLFLALEYYEVFGKAAVLSPSIWWDRRSILRLVREADSSSGIRFWLDMGLSEGDHHVRDADLLFTLLQQRGWMEGQDLAYDRVEGGVHHEDAWAARFHDVLRFLFPAADIEGKG